VSLLDELKAGISSAVTTHASDPSMLLRAMANLSHEASRLARYEARHHDVCNRLQLWISLITSLIEVMLLLCAASLNFWISSLFSLPAHPRRNLIVSLQVRMNQTPAESLRVLAESLSNLQWTFIPPLPQFTALSDFLLSLALFTIAKNSNSTNSILDLFDEPKFETKKLLSSRETLEASLAANLLYFLLSSNQYLSLISFV
jgi:hypothetical protein